MENSKKRYIIEKILLIGGVISTIVGYFLWTILIPIQDIDLLSKAELLELQKEIALNYSLGRVMMLSGVVGIIVGIVLLLYNFIAKRKNDY
ncbi:MAG: hypothetical protein IJZ23_02680 [Roseburia sp.]|nr:hypothetical protein [Roseburia sp.]